MPLMSTPNGPRLRPVVADEATREEILNFMATPSGKIAIYEWLAQDRVEITRLRARIKALEHRGLSWHARRMMRAVPVLGWFVDDRP